MRPKKVDNKKRRNKRKVRTEDVSSASSSDNESVVASEPKQQASKSVQEPEKIALKKREDDAPVFTTKKPKQDHDKVFEDFYLRQATREFANDLDKLRSAGDFNAKSVSLLISALKQGTACFSADERRKVAESLER